jgi:hypothetical protein
VVVVDFLLLQIRLHKLTLLLMFLMKHYCYSCTCSNGMKK